MAEGDNIPELDAEQIAAEIPHVMAEMEATAPATVPEITFTDAAAGQQAAIEAQAIEVEPMTPLPEGIPPAEPGEIIMSRADLGKSRKPWLKEATFRIYTTGLVDGHSQGWWGKDMNGYKESKLDSGTFDLKRIMTYLSSHDTAWLYVEGDPDYKAPPVDPNNPKRLGSMTSLVGPIVVKMLMAAPNNGTLRAKVMAALGEMPPKEADTFEKLRDWVEFNFPKPRRTPEKDHIMDMVVTFTERESGTCQFTREQKARAIFKILPRDIDGVLDGADTDDFDEFMTQVASKVEELATESVTSYEETDLSTDRHTADEVDREDYDYPYAALKNAVREYLKKHKPEAAAAMELE